MAINIQTNSSDVLPIVMGVNEQTMSDDDRNVEAAPADVVCTSLLLKVLDDSFGIARAFFTATRSELSAPTLSTADTVRIVGQVLPALRGIVDGNTLAISSESTDFVTVTAELQSPVTAPELREAFRQHAAGPMVGIMEFHAEPVAASEVAHQPFSAIVDASAARVIGNNLVQVTAFYDNSCCHQARILELKKFQHYNE